MMSINMGQIRKPMNSFRLCMKTFSILVLIVCLAFSGFHCASIGSVAMERGIIGQNPSALDSGNATQTSLTENAFSVTFGINKLNPKLGNIPETDGEYYDNHEEYLVYDVKLGNNNADGRLQKSHNSDEHYDLLAEDETNDVESTDEENPAESQVLKRIKRKGHGRGRGRGRSGSSGTPYTWRGCGEYRWNGFIKKGHDSKLARDHTHSGMPCPDYDRTFHWPSCQNSQFVPKGKPTFYTATAYIWGECNDTLDTSKESKQTGSTDMGSSVLDPVNGTDADTVSTTPKPVKIKTHIDMCPVAFATAPSMQRLSFMATLIPILMGLLYYRN